VLDPPFIHEQPVQDPAVGEVLYDRPAQVQIALAIRLVFRLTRAFGLQRLHELSQWAGPIGKQGIEDLILNPFNPLKPPRQTDNPFRQHSLHRPSGSQLPEHRLTMLVKLRLILSFDDIRPTRQPMLDGVLCDGCLPLRCTRPRGLPGVLTIGNDFCFSSHCDALRIYNLPFTIYDCVALLPYGPVRSPSSENSSGRDTFLFRTGERR
jgi:hypothetical protein